MCGICGQLRFDDQPVQYDVIQKMTSIVSHRGPDGEGIHINGKIGLGHRRLSIIDLATGDQPMFSDDRQIAIVFNGEIYNYKELKEELEKLGHRFLTASDTEVIIKSYQEWGFDCQSKFNGMWAFAIWDERKQLLFLSRDRMGEKPLNYALRDRTFYFGSEIKSILQAGFPKEPNQDVLEIYLTLCYVPAPFSFYKGIHKLEPGHYIIAKDGDYSVRSYWDLPDVAEGDFRKDAGAVSEEFEELLADSVRLRMRSDVPFGAFLSGGLDSASVVCLMSDISKHPVETFTIGFDEEEYDERFLARIASRQFKTMHHEAVVEPSSFEQGLRQVIFHYDEPFGDSSAIPTGYVSKYAREKVKMVLTGDGGDEVLSGYVKYQGLKFAQQYHQLPGVVRSSLPQVLDFLSRPVNGRLGSSLRRVRDVFRYSNMDPEQRFLMKLACTEYGVIKPLVNNTSTMKFEDFYHDFMRKCPYQDQFYRLMYYDLKLKLPDDMLVKVDRMSMAHSLETRIPFLDHRIVELLASVDKNVKMQGYERKSILRRSLGRRLPKPLLSAGKKGFAVPLRDWFKQDSFEDQLGSLSRSDFGLDRTTIEGIIERNRTGIEDNGNFIWMLFVLKEWLLN